jgi:hypothetical protein
MMTVTRCSKLCFSLLAIVFAGCGGNKDDIAPVHGRVTLDGQPLPNARVEFRAAGKSLSNGMTDDQGNYELIYKRGVKGAPIGPNQVSILEDTRLAQHPQRVPARYNENSELQKDVKPGENVIDFELTSEKNGAK